MLAGVGGGLSGSIAGLASLVSYPALLAAGLSPIHANVTNTIALVFSSIGSISSSRPELSGQLPRLRRLCIVGVAGGAAGGAVLLVTPAGSFERVVPWLIGLSALAVLIKRPTPHPDAEPRPDSWLLLPGTFLVGAYIGYFGAAGGVLMLALLLATIPETLARSNAVKNVVLGVSNAISAVIFLIFSTVDWTAAIPLAVGFFIGGRIGPTVVRHSPAQALRLLIAMGGVGLAIYLALSTYS